MRYAALSYIGGTKSPTRVDSHNPITPSSFHRVYRSILKLGVEEFRFKSSGGYAKSRCIGEEWGDSGL